MSKKSATPQAHRRAKTIARLAVQLAREDAGLYMTPKEIAGAAAQIVSAACDARAALTRRKSARSHYDAARKLLVPFGAELVDHGDVNGMVVGLRFHSGRFTSGAGNVFYVA
jgi:hypothetical protein